MTGQHTAPLPHPVSVGELLTPLVSPATAGTLGRERGLLPQQRQGGLPHSNALLPFVASARHPGRRHRKDGGSSSRSPWRRAGHGRQHRQLFWEGDVGLIPAPRPLRLPTREQSQQRFLASPLRWGLPRALNTYFLLSEGSFVPNRENGKAGVFLFRIPFPWGASSCSGRSSP